MSPEIGESSNCDTPLYINRFSQPLRVCTNVYHGSPSMDGAQKLAVVFFLVYWTSQGPEAQGQGKLSTVVRRYLPFMLATVHSFRLVSSLQF